MAPVEMPVVGDLVMFLSHAFQVCDDFPTGSPVGPHVAFVDWRNVFRVEEVRQALYETPRRRRGPRRRGGAPSEVLLVAVKLSSTNGTMVDAVHRIIMSPKFAHDLSCIFNILTKYAPIHSDMAPPIFVIDKKVA